MRCQTDSLAIPIIFFLLKWKKQLCEGIMFLQMVQFDASQSLFRPNYFEISEFLYLAVA